MTQLMNYATLDGGTQYKILDRVRARLQDMPKDFQEKRAVEAMIDIIEDETRTALGENVGNCGECGMEATEMEWQEFDLNFICPECGNVMYPIKS